MGKNMRANGVGMRYSDDSEISAELLSRFPRLFFCFLACLPPPLGFSLDSPDVHSQVIFPDIVLFVNYLKYYVPSELTTMLSWTTVCSWFSILNGDRFSLKPLFTTHIKPNYSDNRIWTTPLHSHHNPLTLFEWRNNAFYGFWIINGFVCVGCEFRKTV